MMRSDADCGCCEGIEVAVPMSEVNPPGLSAIGYRVGTYGTFYETMLARLSSLALEVPSASGGGADTVRPLTGLTTRDASDPSIALLDAWAVVGDVLTFYQERIANEGYLPTATERRSLIELGRLVGYRLRPGLSATVKLAFTAAKGVAGDIPAGTRAQSIPNAGENPQFFETSAVLAARDEWNALPPLLSRPQSITPPGKDDDIKTLALTDARVVQTLYFDGLATSLKPSDRLIFDFGSMQTLRVVQDVIPQPPDGRTLVTLAPDPVSSRGPLIGLWLEQAKYLFPDNSIADSVAHVLDQLQTSASQAPKLAQALVAAAVAAIMQQRDLAKARRFSRLGGWLNGLLSALQQDFTFAASREGAGTAERLPIRSSLLATSSLGNLAAAAAALAIPRSVQPANPLHLARSVTKSFAPLSDVAPRVLATLRPAVAAGLYGAWRSLETPPSRLQILVARVKATLFAGTFQPAAPATATATTAFTAPARPDLLPLDAIYDQIKPGSAVAIEVPGTPPKFHRVVGSQPGSMGLTVPIGTDPKHQVFVKVTMLLIDPAWTSTANLPTLRQTVIYAQCEPLTLVEEPVDADIGGSSIDIDGVLEGLRPGRWVIVSGNRTDVANVAGVGASEAVMIAGVMQGASSPNSADFLAPQPFFETVSYVTDANPAGDRLVVGKLRAELIGRSLLEPIAGHSYWRPPQFTDQVYGTQIELGPDAEGQPVYATAYVPTADELGGSHPSFLGMLVDPKSGLPYLDDTIPSERRKDGIFAWRIANRKLKTSLLLANALAYRYDRATVTIHGNVVDATQGQSSGEVLGDGNATAAFAAFALKQKPLTYLPAPTPSGVSSTLQIRVNELAWHESPDLFSAAPGQRTFVTREDDAGRTRVTFGDGVHGARLPTGIANIKATYRYGMGKSGNVAAGQISQLATQPLGLKGVVNPLPATGGADADRADQARANIPIATLALDRLLSARDYGDFARNFAGIGKASARSLSDGLREVVHVTIAGVDDSPITLDDGLARNLLAAFSINGDPLQPVELGIRRLRLLVIAAVVTINPDYLWDDVAPAVRNALLATFGWAARALGQAAFASEAIAAMQSVRGVSCVNLTVFNGIGEDISAGALASLAKTLALRPFVGAQLADIDTGTAPGSANRIRAAELVMATPDIPDTIILTQAPP